MMVAVGMNKPNVSTMKPNSCLVSALFSSALRAVELQHIVYALHAHFSPKTPAVPFNNNNNGNL